MPGKNKGPSPPQWVRKRPTEDKLNLIKEHSYDYLKEKFLNGEDLAGATAHIPGYIEKLTEFDADFGKIKPHMCKTTHLFIDAIRMDLKNKIKKINDEAKNAEAEEEEPEEEDQEEEPEEE